MAKKASPLVSVLVPIYNVERYLSQCLDSLVGQDYEQLEIILIDDGSTDSSPAIIDEYASRDERIVAIHKPNSGYGASMNRGLERARGTYIGIVEPDDHADPAQFAAYVKAAEETGADLVRSGFTKVWEDGTEVQVDLFAGLGVPEGKPIEPRDHPQLITVRPAIWAALYRRSMLDQNGIRFAETPGAAFQDTSFSLMALTCAHTMVIVPGYYLHYRMDNESSSSNSTDKVYTVCDEYDRALAHLRTGGAGEVAAFGPAQGADRMGAYLWNLLRIAPECRKGFCERWVRDIVDLEEEGLIDLDLIRSDSRELLGRLVDDPSAFARQSACHPERIPEWISFSYMPFEADMKVEHDTGVKGTEASESVISAAAASAASASRGPLARLRRIFG